MVKKLGASATTTAVDSSKPVKPIEAPQTVAQTATEKWAAAMKDRLHASAIKATINAKAVPVSYVIADPDNCRELAVTQEQVLDLAVRFPMDRATINSDDCTEWLEGYKHNIESKSGLKGKALEDLLSIIDFAASLKSAVRLMNPIMVWQEDSVLHLISGERRLFAHIFLGEEFIFAIIRDNSLDRSEIDLLQWEENVQREDMTLPEKILRVRKLILARGKITEVSVTQVSHIIGRSRAEAQRYTVVLRYPDTVLLDAICAGQITNLKTAASLAQLSKDQIIVKLNKGYTNSKSTEIKIPKTTDLEAVKVILFAAAKQLDANDVVEQYDLTKHREINKAINALVKKVGNSNG